MNGGKVRSVAELRRILGGGGEAMKRIWFKPDCVSWIREGKKTTTFRKNRHSGVYEVVRGSWFNPEPVGLYVKLAPIEIHAASEVVNFHFSTEGNFKNPTEFGNWLKEVRLLRKLPELGWLHRIEVVDKERVKEAA